jgi:hypothetical protein
MTASLRTVIGCLALSAACWPTGATALTSQEVYEILVDGQCHEARVMIEGHAQAASFLQQPYNRMLYGNSLCCSPRQNLSKRDLGFADGHLAVARPGLDPAGQSWVDEIRRQCRARLESFDDDRLSGRQLSEARANLAFVVVKFSGKIMGRCDGGNLSPSLIPGEEDRRKFAYLMPNPIDGALQPPASHLDELRASYVGDNPRLAVCPPFIALSADQDPNRICSAAHDFMNFFSEQFDARRPPVWIALFHYPALSQGVYDHAKNTSGRIRCQGLLGYFDWQRQSLVYSAPSGWFGTFDHELAHALMFWDLPLAPRWFDEGVAALFENARWSDDRRLLRGIENPWRSEVLRRSRTLPLKLEHFEDVVNMAVLEFEERPWPATASREFMRRVQDCGDLPGLYRQMRVAAATPEHAEVMQRDPFDRPPESLTRFWFEMAKAHAGPSSCN